MKKQDNPLFLYIPKGQENAISGKDLAQKMGMGTRRLRSEVHNARAAGFPILSDVTGYYMPASKSESEAFLGAWKRRMNSARVTTAPARREAAR